MSLSLGGSKSKSSSTQTNPYAIAQYNSAKSSLPTSYSGVTDQDINRFQNPFTSSVIDSLQSDYADTSQLRQNQVDDDYLKAGAFGGSRHGIASGVTEAQGQKDLAGIIAQLRATGYNTALDAAMQENAAENQYPLLLQGILGQLAGQTQTNTKGTSSGIQAGASFTYGGR